VQRSAQESSYRMLWRDECLLVLFPKVAFYTGLFWDGRSLHHMKQSNIVLPYFGFAGQSDRASPSCIFVKQSDIVSPWACVIGQSDVTLPGVSVTGQTVRDLCCSQWLVSSDLERLSKDQVKQHFASRPWDFQWSTTRTEQGICLLTISVLAEGDSFGQAK